MPATTYLTRKLYQAWLALVLVMVSCSMQTFPRAHEPLPLEKAFQFTLAFKGEQELRAHWHITTNYYLYKDKVTISSTPATTIIYPQAEFKVDRGKSIAIYRKSISVPLHYAASEKNVDISIDYQGCSKHGFCYPPVTKQFKVNFANKKILQKDGDYFKEMPARSFWQSLLTNQITIKDLLSTENLGLTLLIFALIGLFLAFTPCVLPLIPILTGIIVGQKQPISTLKAFFLSLSYVVGSAITYALAGVIAALMGSSMQVWLQKPEVLGLAAVIFILLALSLFGFYDLRLPHRWHNRMLHMSNKQQGGDYVGVFLMGMLSSLIVSPCVTAPLVGVLLYIAQTGNIFFGASALFVMGLGMGLPLLIIGISAGHFLPKSGPWMVIVKKIFGLFLLGIAIKLFSRLVPPLVATYLWDIFLMGSAIFFYQALKKFRKHFYYRLALLISVMGAILFILSEIPLFKMPLPQTNAAYFRSVANVKELQQEIYSAAKENTPVLLDFYADWCDSCVIMENEVFSNNEVQAELKNFRVLRADLTKNSDADQQIMQAYKVIAPPTILFFNRLGQEVKTQPIVGEITAREFLMRLHSFFTTGCDKQTECM